MLTGVWVRRVIIGLILGAITTVAIAWSAMVAGRRKVPTTTLIGHMYLPVTRVRVCVQETSTFGISNLIVLPLSGSDVILPDIDAPSWVPQGLTEETPWWVEIRCGWPFRAMKLGPREPTADLRTAPLYPTIAFAWRGWTYELPVVPLYSAFAANTMIYAVAWVATSALIAKLRRHRRVGKCHRCLYNLRGLPTNSPCPECGAPSPSAA